MIKPFSSSIDNIKSATAIKVSDSEIERVVKVYGLTKNHVKTVLMVESGGSGFYADNRPRILFEAHIFSKLTNHVYDISHPNISSKVWNKSLYSKVSENEYSRLEVASTLNNEDALKSASWGLFQILGMNYRECGCESVDEFILQNCYDEVQMVTLFLNFIRSNGLTEHLKKQEWAEFAKGYNGSLYQQNQYDTKLKANFDKLTLQAKSK